MAGARQTQGLKRWELLGSLSAYYYTGAVGAFVGILFAMGLFLFSYKGYDNEYYARDRFFAVLAGVAAIFVAFYPTNPPHGLAAAIWWRPWTATVHYVAAAALFSSFAVFCLVLFRKTDAKPGDPRDPGEGAAQPLVRSVRRHHSRQHGVGASGRAGALVDLPARGGGARGFRRVLARQRPGGHDRDSGEAAPRYYAGHRPEIVDDARESMREGRRRRREAAIADTRRRCCAMRSPHSPIVEARLSEMPLGTSPR